MTHPVNDKDGSQATYSSLFFSSHRIGSLFYLTSFNHPLALLLSPLDLRAFLLQSQLKPSSPIFDCKVRDLGSNHSTRPRLAPSVDLTRSKGLHSPP